MKNVKLSALTCLAIIFSFQSCQKDEVIEEQVVNEIAPEIIDKLDRFYLNSEGVEKVDFMLPDGSVVDRYQVEGDILLSKQQIMDLDIMGGVTDRNYRTNNLVSQGRTITIIGYTGGNSALTTNERTALQWAVNNYNRLNTSISFSLTFGTDYQSKDMVIYNNRNQNGAGGSAGFPTGGRPHKFVQIYGLSNYNTNVIEHVITHEIGHSVGFRHTDWQTRRSCGQNTNEGQAGVGAIVIPGTTTAYDPTSIMLACFSNGEDGEFNRNDIIALEYMY